MNLAKNALPKDSTESFTSSNHNIKTGGNYSSLSLTKGDGRYVFIETTSHEEGSFCAIGYREPDSSNINVVHFPRKSGYVAIANEHYSKSESDSRFIQLNTDTKTSGYILAKTANYYDDPNSRHLGRSGFLRPNGIDNLGALAIHIAHPDVDSSQHARGLSFGYGGYSEAFSISTYAFDEDGKFKGKKRILTEDDVIVPVGVPLPYPHRYTPVGYLTCNGQTFDKSLYPKLAEAYPTGRVPDLRGEFIRGWDDSRGVDPGRVCGTWQGDAIRNITGDVSFGGNFGFDAVTEAAGVFAGKDTMLWRADTHRSDLKTANTNLVFNASRVVPTANENRPRNIAFNYIVRIA
ncbi:phage tail protein [Photorhabdus viridis]|uniref:phage tail protein n=1 Tax=Photorhabdus viridis TaxID=3163327 RepID=UPI0033078C3D